MGERSFACEFNVELYSVERLIIEEKKSEQEMMVMA
jgi:hypothetical protein